MYRLSAVIVILLTVLFSTAALAFDNEPSKIDISDINATYSYVRVNTFGSALGIGKSVDLRPDIPLHRSVKRKTHFLLGGVGFVVKKGYIVTAAHVVHPSRVRTMGDYNQVTTEIPIKILSRHIMVSPDVEVDGLLAGFPVELYHLDIERDIAILKYDEDMHDMFKPIPFRMVYTRGMEKGRRYDTLTPGMAVSTVVRERDEDGNWEYSLEVRNAKLLSGELDDLKYRHLMLYTDFSVDLLVYNGDSGAPAFAFICGEPVVIGVIRATHFMSRFGGRPDTPVTAVARIDTIKTILEAE